MAKIHPLAFLIIGGIVSAISGYMVYSLENSTFTLFLIIGALLFTYGLASWFIFRKPSENNPKNIENSHPFAKWLSSCPYCKANIPNNSVFCPYCGRRL